MQIIVDFGLDVQQYHALVMTLGVRGLVIEAQFLWCPFCKGKKKKHRLWRHGSYERFVVVAELDVAITILVVRLYCCKKGQTVSLLPHFLAPRKQHTWEVMGTYFSKIEIEGCSRVAAMEAATKIKPSRQKGAYWSRCLEENLVQIQTYLSGIRPRLAGAPCPSTLLKALRRGYKTLGEALARHNLMMHKMHGVWLL